MCSDESDKYIKIYFAHRIRLLNFFDQDSLARALTLKFCDFFWAPISQYSVRQLLNVILVYIKFNGLILV